MRFDLNLVLQTIADEEKCINISSNEISKDRWFIGSALMGVNYKALDKGKYYYKQETIWSRALEVSEINPYWEVYNRTYNFLLVDERKEIFFDVIEKIIDAIKKEIPIENNIYVISADKDIISWFQSYNCKELRIDFCIENEVVGVYTKIFVALNGNFYPLFDITTFNIRQKNYYEININETYIEFIFSRFFKESYIEKFNDYINENNIEYKKFWNELIYDLDLIRLISLIDCLKQLSKMSYCIGNDYKGHIVKKILKEVTFYSLVNKYNLDCRDFNDEYEDYINKETIKVLDTYPNILKKNHDIEILADRYGINSAVIDFLKGTYEKKHFSRDLKNVKYFTDIPFIKENISEEQFFNTLKKIIERKKKI